MEVRLRKRREFNHCQKTGIRTAGRWLVIFASPSERGSSRLGLAVSRKAGGSVTRNLLKRRLREIFRRGPAAAEQPGLDLCASVRRGAGSVDFNDLAAEFWSLVSKARRKL